MRWLLGCALLVGSARGQAGDFQIAGKVVSSFDGRPLNHATVAIESVKTRAPVATVVTGTDGAFAFDHLAAAKFTLLGDAAGFLAADYDQHEGFSTAIVTGAAGVDAEHLVLRLKPSAGVSGRVLDEAGEPVRTAQVTLYRESYATGQRVVGTASGVMTDDRGEYAIAPLAEGKYYLGVRATPWYATHPEARNDNGGSPVITGVDPALDVAYPLTFYPDVLDWHDATPLELKGGSETRVDLRLAPVRAARLMIRKAPGEEQIGFPDLRVKVFDTYEPVGSQGRSNGGDSMEMVGLPPGEYRAQQHSGKTGEVTSSGMVDLRGGTGELASSAAAAWGSLKVVVELQGGGKLPAGLRVFLQNPESSANPYAVNDKGEVTMESVAPGEYHVAVFVQGRGYTVMRVEVKGKPVSRNKLTVNSGEAAQARVVIAGGPLVSVEGIAQRAGKGVAGAMIVLVPVDDTDDAELFRRDQSDLDGTFALPQVLPGRYIAVAIEDGWQLEWGNAAVLSKYLLKGVAVEVGAGAARTMKLPESLAVQPR